MNDRFFKDKITVYHVNSDDTVSIEQFSKVYFRHNKKTNLVDKGLEKGSTGSITIPATNTINISTNDYIVEGLIDDEFNLREMQKKCQVFKVVSVDDNRKGGLQHYKIGVSE